MRKPAADVYVMAALILSCMLAAWLGIAGEALAEIRAKSLYEFLKDWQTLIGALVALVAAVLAIRPVWKQLEEIQYQSSQRAYEQLTARSTNLHREREALYLLTSAVDLMARSLGANPSYDPIGGLQANTVLGVKNAENYLRSCVAKFKDELGPIWGDAKVQTARNALFDETLKFCNELTKLTDRIVVGNRIPAAEIDAYVQVLLPHKTALFSAAEILHTGIVEETKRIGARVELLERNLLS